MRVSENAPAPAASGSLSGAGRRFVLVMVFTLACLSGALGAYFFLQQREYNSFSFQNVVWEAVQFRNEHQVFRTALLETLAGAPKSSMAELKQRYDILYSRLELLHDGEPGVVLQSNPRLHDLAVKLDRAIRGWETELAAYSAGNRAAGLAIAAASRSLDPNFNALAANLNILGVQRIEEAKLRSGRLYNALIAAIAVICLLVFGFAFALLRQLRLTERAHADLRAITGDLDLACHQAEQASRAKTNFLATMSHELRTPLNAILGFADVMRQGVFGSIDNPRYRDYLDGIMKSGQHLLALINDVLDMSRIEAGKLELNEADIDIGAAIDQALSLVQVTADGKGVRLDRSIPAGLPRLRADKRLLQQMLLNLLSNAVKFTAEGGQVEIAAAMLTDGELAIRVRDTGSGMTDAQLRRVFEPFSQGDSLRAREIGGSGLGLPITRRLIELHQGRIHLSSRRSIGTTAILIFPAQRLQIAEMA
ncbi:MAG TPA: ATP-binding protein [Ferrovibrio sp.]|uniref:sensor histidine kinase n=1 Tax=Ferrovibrio sp. TaxID=1917215 RepID=UPI002ED149B1